MPKRSIPKEKLEKEMKKIKNELVDQVYCVITPKDEEWDVIRELQQSNSLPSFLREVRIYTIPRQYERQVMEMEHYKILEVKLVKPSLLNFSPRYIEIVFHHTCYNPRKGRLHVLLKKYESLEDLHILLVNTDIFTPPTYR